MTDLLTVGPPTESVPLIDDTVEPALRHRSMRSRNTNLLVLAVYALVSLVADLPIWPGDPSRVPTILGSDIYQTIWFLEWTPWALVHGHNLFETTIINNPVGVDLAQNTGMPLLGLVTAPLTLLVSPVASMNLLRFLAFALSAYAAYYVLRKFVNWVPAAFLGGLFYGFSPYMVTQGTLHLDLIFVPLPPLLLWATFDLFVTQTMPPIRRGLLLGLGAAAQFYISAEILTTTAIVTAIGTFFLFFLCIGQVRRHLRHALIGIAAAGALAAALMGYPIFVILHGHAHYVGPAQGFPNVYNADLLGPVLPTMEQLVAPHRLAEVGSKLVGAQIQENGSYLGIPLIVIVVYLVARYWRRLWPLYLALLTLATFLLSLGPNLVIDGKTHPLPFSLPFKKLDKIPAAQSILPVRFSLYVTLFVAIILAMGIDAYHSDWLRQKAVAAARGVAARRRVIFAAVGACALGALALVVLLPNWPYTTFPLHQNYATSAKGLRIVPTGSIVLAYPYPTSFEDSAMLWQALDDMRFSILGSYALVPNSFGKATVFPSRLKPISIEALLVNSVTPVPDPDLPDLVATNRTIYAAHVVAYRPGILVHSYLGPTITGRVTWVDPTAKEFFVRDGITPALVRVDATTTYVEHWALHPSLAGIATGETVKVYGLVGRGTLNHGYVTLLRAFLRQNKVDVVIVGLGVTDGGVIASWFRDALGPATRAGGGGEIWTDVPTKLLARV